MDFALPLGTTLAPFTGETTDRVDGAGAFAELWMRTPGFRWFGRIARLPIIHGVLDRAYGIFLDSRPVLQKLLSRSGKT